MTFLSSIIAKYTKIWYDSNREQHSTTYQHFKKPVIVDFKGKKMFAFTCKTNPSITLHRAPYEDSTGNFASHIAKCDPAKKGNIAAFAAGSTYTPASFHYKIAIWCARRSRPFNIVKDAELVDMFKMLYSRVEIPHPRTVSRDIQDIYNLTKPVVAEMLGAYIGKVHFAVDGWASPDHISVLGISCYRYQEGRVEEFTIDFVRLRQSHTGEYLACMFFKTLEEFNVTQKILALAGDNVKNQACRSQGHDPVGPEPNLNRTLGPGSVAMPGRTWTCGFGSRASS
ncbi:hypothetical protein VKT23_008187 [Stygiomarasmius scandens]|uniref:Transposase n=1 Tax=Marasmiellus scandens TaxID=2682957 RepID=A0ABR1JI42_9AGAR